MGQFRFVSNRQVKNKAGAEAGRIRVLVKADSNTAETDYKCPECLFEEHVSVEFLRPFFVKCPKCGVKINLPKLKDEVKKEKNLEKKKRKAELMATAKQTPAA